MKLLFCILLLTACQNQTAPEPCGFKTVTLGFYKLELDHPYYVTIMQWDQITKMWMTIYDENTPQNQGLGVWKPKTRHDVSVDTCKPNYFKAYYCPPRWTGGDCSRTSAFCVGTGCDPTRFD